MKGIPPEIDRLLWAVAEDESPRAAEEFVERYPKYAGELARRRSLVQSLKGGRPGKPVVPPRPVFHPVPVKPIVPRRTVAVVGGLVLAAIAVASYTVATIAIPRSTPTVPAPVSKVPTGPVEVDPAKTATIPANVPDRPVAPESLPDKVEAPPVVASSSEKPHTLKVKGADLANSLAMLGVEAGVTIILAPGMPARTIDADYEDMPLSKILADLARRYGFTPFDQGDGTIIIVPAVDNRDTPSSTPTDSSTDPVEDSVSSPNQHSIHKQDR